MSPQAGGVSASAGVTLNRAVVNLKVTPQASGDVTCVLTCNGREATVVFQESGDVNLEIEEGPAKT